MTQSDLPFRALQDYRTRRLLNPSIWPAFSRRQRRLCASEMISPGALSQPTRA